MALAAEPAAQARPEREWPEREWQGPALVAPGAASSAPVARDALGPDRPVDRQPVRKPTLRSRQARAQPEQSLSLRQILSSTTNRSILSEGCTYSEPELEPLLRLKVVVQHTAPLRIVGKNEPKRN